MVPPSDTEQDVSVAHLSLVELPVKLEGTEQDVPYPSQYVVALVVNVGAYEEPDCVAVKPGAE